MKRLIAIVTAIIFVFSFSACGNDNKSSDGRLSVICTAFAQYDFARIIAGDNALVQMLIPPGSEAHTYEPTPGDILKLKNSDLFITVGGESEQWAEYMIKSSDNKNLNVLKLTDIVKTLEEETVDGMDTDSKHGHEDDEHEIDEHVWTSPENAIVICNRICEVLCKADPKNAKSYRDNTSDYVAKLSDLSDELRNTVNSSVKNTLIFADRFPFRYLTEEYGIEYFAAFPGCSEQTEPSAATVTFLADKVKADKAKVIICVDFGSERIAKAIRSENKTKIMRMYSCHNISKKQLESGEDYLSLMHKNVLVIKEALN